MILYPHEAERVKPDYGGQPSGGFKGAAVELWSRGLQLIAKNHSEVLSCRLLDTQNIQQGAEGDHYY